MNKEYEIKGTIAGIKEILEKDFGMSPDETRFFVYTYLRQEDSSEVDKQEIDKWYYSDEVKYSGRILKTRYCISFSDIKIELYKKAFQFLVLSFFNRGFSPEIMGLELISFVIASLQKVKDEDLCVFERIVELNALNKGRLFDVNDIVTANKDQKCDHQDHEWKCPHLRSNDNCINVKEKIFISLKELKKQHIIKPVGEYWRLI